MSSYDTLAYPFVIVCLTTYFYYVVYDGYCRRRRRPLAAHFVYIIHLISVDLQSSSSLNSPTLHCYSYDPGLHHLLTNQILPHSRSNYFYYLCSVLSFFTYQTNGRSNPTNVLERTDESNRQNKVSPRR